MTISLITIIIYVIIGLAVGTIFFALVILKGLKHHEDRGDEIRNNKNNMKPEDIHKLIASILTLATPENEKAVLEVINHIKEKYL